MVTLAKLAKDVKRLVARYTYEDGEIVMQHVRYEHVADGGKSFAYRWRTVEEDLFAPRYEEPLAWHWEKPPAADHMLFQQQEAEYRIARGAPELWWTEGEKDALALRRVRVLAVSHHGGAGHATPQQAAVFQGYPGTVVLATDNDVAGAADAVERYRLLRLNGIASDRIRFVRAAVGKDVADHLAAGLSVADFVEVTYNELLTEAERYKSSVARDSGYDWAELTLVQGPRAAEADEDRPSWAPVDLSGLLAGTVDRPQPQLLRQDDGQALLYPGKAHAFVGESESGKSWLAQCAAAEQLLAGGRVLYIDFESDAPDVVGRLRALGVPAARLTPQQFAYVRPEHGLARVAAEREAFAELLGQTYQLAVLDGVTDALGIFGWSLYNNDEAARFLREVARPLARHTGAAVVLVDHVVKDREGRGRYAIGAQAKLAGIDGRSTS